MSTVRLPQDPATLSTPHNKSKRAREAEARGERTWTNWRLAHLVDEALRLNHRGLTSSDLRSVRPLEFLKVKLLVPTEHHHVRLRIEELRGDQVHYYGINRKLASSLTRSEVQDWIRARPTESEIDEMVENLTGHRFYRQRR